MLIKQISYLLILISYSLTAQARWASIDEAAVKVDYSNILISIDKDGLIDETFESQETILKESGREYAVNFKMFYDEYSNDINIIEAKTIYQGVEYLVDHQMIEDKPLASSNQGFDQVRQILISFPKVEVGSKIYLKYQKKHREIPVSKTFSDIFYFGRNEYLEQASIQINSKLPLELKINDPDNSLNIYNTPYFVKINLNKPIYKKIVNEPKGNIINHQYFNWISISSVKKWSDLATKIAKLYQPILTQPLPESLAKLIKEAQLHPTNEAQIDTIIARINDQIQYMGDWRSVKGRFIPRNLDKIIDSQIGDCKDFAALTVVLLRKLSFTADVVLVKRGIGNFTASEVLPSPYYFNHAMVKAIDSNGRVYWLDPTNYVSMSGGIFPDIANKMALVLSTTHPAYEQIPDIDFNHAKVDIRTELKKVGNKINNVGIMKLIGEEAVPFTGIELNYSKQSIKDILFNEISNGHLEQDEKKLMEIPSLVSRIVKDIQIIYEYESPSNIIKTNLGEAINITMGYSVLNNLFATSHDHHTDIYLGTPVTINKQSRISTENINHIKNLDFQITSPWLVINRTTKLIDSYFEINDTIKVLKSYIPNKATKSAEFWQLKQELEQNYKHIAVVIN